MLERRPRLHLTELQAFLSAVSQLHTVTLTPKDFDCTDKTLFSSYTPNQPTLFRTLGCSRNHRISKGDETSVQVEFNSSLILESPQCPSFTP